MSYGDMELGDKRDHTYVAMQGCYLVRNTLEALGYTVALNPTATGHGDDIQCNGVVIEVKTSRLRRIARSSRGYHFRFNRWGTGVRSDFTVLVCLPFILSGKLDRIFIMPSVATTGLETIGIYKSGGRWRKYEDAWELLLPALG